MGAIAKINQLAKEDDKIQALGEINVWQKDKDTNHLERRQQQRAISNIMLSITLAYGEKQYSYGALSYTLTDRKLLKTRYAKFTQELRGLKVICSLEEVEIPKKVLTAYWNKEVIRKARA